MPKHQPPFTLNNKILSQVAEISEAMGRLSVVFEQEQSLKLRRVNRMRTIQGSLAIEGNTLSEEQITAILDGKRIIAPPKEVKEASNAIAVYEQLDQWQPEKGKHLLAAHKVLMLGLEDDAGTYRSGGVGVMSGKKVVHMAPQAERVPGLMKALFTWLKNSDAHPLITSSVFHYEFEFIHPFADGNGRMGRLWQTLILSKWHSVFAYIPVESLVHQHQDNYYLAIRQSTAQGESTPFIEFMLGMIYQAIKELSETSTTQKTDQKTTQKTTQNQQAILDYLKIHPQASRKELAEMIDTITESGVKYNLKALQDMGLLKRIGSARSGHWKVLD
ncbi:Fic family protein [Aliikangiella coralliicola]|uniref:Fic family protein n=1 Tax=Aliikangiella coralliicola TaxID=2592383 RepID=A0A545UDM6_9GAMM|nr:Fic family protein [Aliikangiella coralliicola]TQV87564.1 Fic family protein [Aliikangiella coralliicola]